AARDGPIKDGRSLTVSGDALRSTEVAPAVSAPGLDDEPGVQAMFLVPRRADITEERFHYHYRWVHGELARETLSRPGGGFMNHYVQSHRLGLLDGLPPLC